MEFDFVKEMENGIVMDYAENKFIFLSPYICISVQYLYFFLTYFTLYNKL